MKNKVQYIIQNSYAQEKERKTEGVSERQIAARVHGTMLVCMQLTTQLEHM